MKSRPDLKLTDDYLFSRIMREEDFCKLFPETLMRRPRRDWCRRSRGWREAADGHGRTGDEQTKSFVI
ncbi:MAG: hypothetical protein SOZ27_02760 [Spirochaetia bacterium]|nr:hypothetical protein [Spirochaetia bacterium]